MSLTRALKQLEKIQQHEPVQIQGPFSMLSSIEKGSALPNGITQKTTVHKWCAYFPGLTDQMDITKGPTKATKLQISVTPDMLALQQPYKPSPIQDAPTLTSDSKVKDTRFTDSSAKCIDGKWKYRAVALNIQQEWK